MDQLISHFTVSSNGVTVKRLVNASNIKRAPLMEQGVSASLNRSAMAALQNGGGLWFEPARANYPCECFRAFSWGRA